MTKTKKLQKVAVIINEIYEKNYAPFKKSKHELISNLRTELEKLDELKKSKTVSSVVPKVSDSSDSTISLK